MRMIVWWRLFIGHRDVKNAEYEGTIKRPFYNSCMKIKE